MLAGIFGIHSLVISARAEAGKAVPGTGRYGMYTSGLTLNSGGSVTDATGDTTGIYDSGSAMEDSGGTISVGAGNYTVQGAVTNNGATVSPAPTTGPVVTDPYAGLTAPTQPANTSSSCCSPVGGTTTLQPGYYSSGLNFNGSGYTVTLAPGLYYFASGITLGQVNYTGNGVIIYIAGGQFNMNSAAQMTLTAPTAAQIAANPSAYSGCTASCANMLIWQSATNSNAMILDSGSSVELGGAIYVPDAQVTLNGGATAAAYGMVVVQSLMMDSTLTLSCTSMPGGVCPGGGSGGSGSKTVALAE